MPARVLVVDDVPVNVRLLEAKLVAEYYDVITATDGPTALRLVKAEKPDIVLLDVMMPEMDGYEVCRRIKAEPETLHIPVVMVTALTDRTDRVKGLEAGADDFLSKPVDDTALFARVRSLLRLKMLIDEFRLRARTTRELGLEAATTPPPEATLEDARVLVVEDNEHDAAIIAEALAQAAETVLLREGGEALAAASRAPFDLAVVSLGLRTEDGLRLCSQLRSRDESRHVPLLILIETEDVDRLVKALELGVNDYLVRPIDRNELTARARTQVRYKRYHDRLRESYEESVALAVTDPLTGLYNRRYLLSHLDTLMRPADGERRRAAALLIDIDHFKRVNDSHGHDAGDAVLEAVAKRIQRSIRGHDLAARYGGEEFVVLLPDAGIDIAERVGERLRRAVAREPVRLSDGTDVAVTVSVGVAAQAEPEDTGEALVSRADKAMYVAKREGRDRVVRAPA